MIDCRYYQFVIGCIVGMGVAIVGSGRAYAILTISDLAISDLAISDVGAIPTGAQFPTIEVNPPADQVWLAQRGVNNQNDFFEQGQEQLEREVNRLQQQPPDPLLTVDASSGRWQPIISKAGNFSIWMSPGTLTEETKTIDTAIGGLTFQVIASNSGRNRSVAAYTDLPQTAATQTPDKVLAAVRDRLKSRGTYPLTSDRSITLGGYPGQELTFKGPDETITIRFYLVKSRLYLVGTRNQGTTINNLASTFLNSFQLLS